MDLSSYQQQIDKAISHLDLELKSLQLGKASAGLVENVNVNASYGMMKIPQVAHVTVMDAQTIKIEPWDKGENKNIEKAIYDADLGITPKNEGEYVLVSIPPLTEERRREVAKQVKAMGEDIKAQVRRIRQDAQKASKTLLENKEISEDEHKGNENKVDDITKNANTKIDDMVKSKSEELMKI